MKQSIKKFGVRLLGALVAVSAIANVWVLQYDSGIVDDKQRLEPARTALVFGGGMQDANTMSDLQTDRVDAAVELYLAGKVLRLRMTGDNGDYRFNEVDAMRSYAVAHGVAPEDIDIDRFGYNTYTSCLRAAQTYGHDEVIAISQRFHLPRIRYLCERQGIQTQAYAADRTTYGMRGRIWSMGIREALARVKAVLDTEFLHPPGLEPNKKD